MQLSSYRRLWLLLTPFFTQRGCLQTLPRKRVVKRDGCIHARFLFVSWHGLLFITMHDAASCLKDAWHADAKLPKRPLNAQLPGRSYIQALRALRERR